MHGRGNSRRDDEPSTSGSAKDSTRSGSVGGNDGVARSVRVSDAQTDSRQPGTIAGMHPGSSAPTMRSRVTVVCAECKKQKLRCDRRIPCESCVKRNTVSRCIYTPAAIEKVDVTSINNRLRVVEGSLNALGMPTQGYQHQTAALQAHTQLYMQQIQNPLGSFLPIGGTGVTLPGAQTVSSPADPSTHRIGQLPAGGDDSKWNTTMPQILALANDARCASAVAPLDGVAALWVREIIQEAGQASSTSQQQREGRESMPFPCSTSGKLVSNASLGLDLQPVDRGTVAGVAAFGFGATRGINPKQKLALHAGLGISSFSHERCTGVAGEEAECGSGSNSGSVDSPTALCTSLAAQLLEQFPSRRARREMLIRLGTANLADGMNCVPFRAFCARLEFMCLAVSGKSNGRVSGSTQTTPPLFSAVAEGAAALAVGALIWATEPSSRERIGDEALRGLLSRIIGSPCFTSISQVSSSSFTGVPSTFAPSGGYDDTADDEEELERPTITTAYALYRLSRLALALHTARHGHAARDVAFIHTHILNAHYLLLAQLSSVDFSGAMLPPEFPPLVGALIWDARAMGLGIDPDEFDSQDDGHDSFTRGGTGIEDSAVKREEDTEIPEDRPMTKGMSLFIKEVRRRLWWWIVSLDLLVSDAYGYNTTIRLGEYSTRLPANVDDSCFHPDSVTLPPPDHGSPERNNTLQFTKLRFIEIAKRVPASTFRSGLVPNADESSDSTNAVAQRLADEIMQWLDELPQRFKLDPADEDLAPATFEQLPMMPLRSPSAEELERNAVRALLITQRCDLVFHAYYALLRLFTPRLPSPLSSAQRRTTEYSWRGGKDMSADRQFAELRVIEPALAVVNAAQMQMAHAPDAPRGTFYMYYFPRKVFDAAIVLAHTAIQQPLYTSPTVIDAIRTALDILSRVLRHNAVRVDTDANQMTEAECIVETLLRRAEKAKMRSGPITAGVKRKHEDVDPETDQLDGPFRLPFLGSGIVNAHTSSVHTSASHRDPSSRAGVALVLSQPSSSVCSGSGPGTYNDETCPRQSTAILGHQGRRIPTVAIRQRLRGRRDSRTRVETSRGSPEPAGSGLRVPPPFATPLQPTQNAHQQHFTPGPSVSPSPSVFPSEMMSISPISPLHRYDGTRSVYDAPGSTFEEPGFTTSGVRPIGDMSVQESPPSSTTYQYPVPSFAVSGCNTPALERHQSRELSTAGNPPTVASGVEVRYGMGSNYSSSPSQLVDRSEAIDNAQPWAPSNLRDESSEPLNAHSPHPTEIYPPMQQSLTQQDHPRTWTGGENVNSSFLAPLWNTSSFTNWSHDVQ